MGFQARFFNVNHGDSILISYDEKGENRTILIDCNLVSINGKLINPAYEHLKKNKIETIDTLIISHLHFDHIAGIDDILKGFVIKKLLIPPFLSSKSELFNEIFKKYKEKISDVTKRTAESTINKRLLGLAHLLNFISNNEHLVEEAGGPNGVLTIPNTADFEGRIFLPLKRIKGVLHQKLKTGDFELDDFPEMNDSSIAVLFEYLGKRVLFAADSTLEQWWRHQSHFQRDGLKIDALFLKVPHHGSKHNNTDELYKYFFEEPSKDKFVLVSANGRSHPHNEFFDLVKKYDLQPFCTNLAKQCTDGKLSSISEIAKMPKEARPFLIHAEVSEPYIPCQGDVTLVIEPDSIKVFNSTATPCVYKPDQVRVQL